MILRLSAILCPEEDVVKPMDRHFSDQAAELRSAIENEEILDLPIVASRGADGSDWGRRKADKQRGDLIPFSPFGSQFQATHIHERTLLSRS